jgi:ubiquinone/menaquinone biosynthesis C-methylase UbiE
MEEIKRTKEILNTYEKIAELYSSRYDLDTRDNSLLDEFIVRIGEKAKVLDLGSGTGRTSGYIKNKKPNSHILGIDFSDKMLEISRKNFPSIDFQKSDILNFIAPAESFDAVIAQSSLFHLEKDELLVLLKKSYKMIKEGGIFGILMQVADEYSCKLLPEPLNSELYMYICFYSEKDLEDLLIEAGFKRILKYKKEIDGSKISTHKFLIIGSK